MTEKDLKELGFKKVKISAKDSGDKPYHYFTYDFKPGNNMLSLISIDSDMAKEDGKWKVEIFEGDLKPFKNKTQVRRYINLIESMQK